MSNRCRSSRCRSLAILLTAVLASSAGTLSGQALSPAFTYQGELRLASGPASGNYDLQFRLYSSPGGPTQIGPTVTASAVAVIDGLFAVPLDFGAAQFAGDRQWLEIAIRPAGGGAYETLTPRTEVTAAPYAWGAAVALANSVTSTSVVDASLQGSDLAPAAIGTAQINAVQVQRRVSGSCSGTQGVQSIAQDGSVLCGNFAGSGGTVTSIATGAGLSGGPITTSGTISVAPGGIGTTQINASQVQRRVSGSCGGSQFMRQVGEDGSVVCGGVATTLDWSLTGNAGTNPATNFIGTTDAQAFEVRAANARSLRIEPSTITFGTPVLPITTNTIAGSHANEVTAAVRGATITGGGMPSGNSDPDVVNDAPNRVTDHYGTVGGGYGNRAGDGAGSAEDRRGATVSGGVSNTASGLWSTVAGGASNAASEQGSSVGGGELNMAFGPRSRVGGGLSNAAVGAFSTVGGGDSNTASGSESTVAGGVDNTASGPASTVGGGRSNCAGGRSSWAGGNRAKVLPGSMTGQAGSGCAGLPQVGFFGHQGTFVWADFTDTDFVSSGPDRFLVRASGGVGFNTNSPITDFDILGNRSGHAALIRNEATSSPDGLAIRLNVSGNPTTTNNFLTFQKADGSSVGSVEGNGAGGVSFNTSGGDYAEYLPLAEGSARTQLAPGSVVAIRGGRVSLDTASAEQLGVVSSNPAISGNDPGAARRDSHALIAFLGQVDVSVTGPVTAGDFLVASGRGDGRAVAVAPSAMVPELLGAVVGRAFTSSTGTDASVRALVGLHPADAAQALVLSQQASEISRLRAELSALAARVAAERPGAR